MICILEDSGDECSVCGKRYKHTRSFLHGYADKEKTLKEVTINTAHGGCRNLQRRISELKKTLLDLEYELFCKLN